MFIDFLSLIFRHEERERQNFYYADRSIWPNKRAAYPIGHKLDSPRRVSNLNRPHPASDLNQLLFFKITKNPSPSLLGMTSFAPQSYFVSGVFIMTSVIVTSSTHKHEHLRSMSIPACVLSRIVLSLTKPNDKI